MRKDDGLRAQEGEWEESYRKRDNFLYYPHEEIIRFVSKNIRKRTGISEFQNIFRCNPSPKILDLGCGIGRHVIYCHELGLDAYGVDLSAQAVSIAVDWAKRKGMVGAEQKIVQGDVRHLPWDKELFDFSLSHGVLDSMHFEIARLACAELYRVMKVGGLFYCDLVSGDDSSHAREFRGEEVVTATHEQGTIQSYFNFAKINDLIEGLFKIEEAFLIRRENVVNGGCTSRHHLSLRRI